MKKFRGTYTVLITPFTSDGKKVDEAALKRLVDFQIEEGIHGLIPLGSTGEFLSVTPDERRQIVETVVKQAAGRVPQGSTMRSSACPYLSGARRGYLRAATSFRIHPCSSATRSVLQPTGFVQRASADSQEG